MRIIKTILLFISPLADILGILSFFGLSITNFNSTKIPWYFYSVLMFSLIILGKLIVKRVLDIKRIYTNLKIDYDLEKISSQKNIHVIEKALPSTKTLLGLYKKALERIENWTDDALIGSFNLYLHYSNKSWNKPYIQINAHSPWKKESCYFYEGYFKSEDYYENKDIVINKSISEKDLFFSLNENWQDLIKKAFSAVNNKLSNECHMSISKDSIWITFYEGKVKKKIKFKVKDNFTEVIAE